MRRLKRRVIRNLRETWKNKICAIIFVLLGLSTIFIDGDATFFVVALLFGLGLFVEKKNVVMV